MMDMSELLNRIKELEESVDTLTTAVNNLSSKYPTPLNLDNSVSAFSAKLKLYDVGTQTPSWGGHTGTWYGLTTDGSLSNGNWYVYNDTTGDVIKYTTAAHSHLFTPTSTPAHLAWDWTNDDKIYCLTDDEIESYDSSGNRLRTVTLTHASWSLGDWTTKAFAHDYTNDVLYAIIYNSSATSMRLVQVNATSGLLSGDKILASDLTGIYDMEILNEVAYAIDNTYNFIWAFDLTSTSSNYFPFAVMTQPSTAGNLICANKDFKFFDMMASTTTATSDMYRRALAYLDRIAVEDASTAENMGYNQVNIAAATETKLLAANAERESFELFNTHASETVYIASDDSIDASNGMPIYPYGSVIIEGYTGDVYVFSTNASSVAYIELY